MNQSSVIGAALVIAYVIFIITRGELQCYLSLLGIATALKCPPNLQPAGCGGTSTSTSTTGSTPNIGIHFTGGGGGGPAIGVNFPIGSIGGGGTPPIFGGGGGRVL